MYSLFTAYLLWFLSGFGALGFHRFYLGKVPSGCLWMLTVGFFGIGSIYDFFTLPNQVREANYRNAIDGINSSQTWRNVIEGKGKIIGDKENVEHAILRIAKDNKGIISASDLALAANISVEEARKKLDAMVSKGYAELHVRQSGSLIYTIPDFMDKDEPMVF